MALFQYCIKAYSLDMLQGNPAAIIEIENWISIELMQRIAFINNFPETVFLKKIEENVYYIYWFTPKKQTYDAGHATLAAQYYLKNIMQIKGEVILTWDENEIKKQRIFNSENYKVLIFDNYYEWGDIQQNIFKIENDLIYVFENENDVKNYKPNFNEIETYNIRGLCITSLTKNLNEYCNRFFAPRYGVNEDFVTATSHKYLASYWANQLNVKLINGIQYSQSQGYIKSKVCKKIIEIEGECCLYAKTEILL